MPATPIPNKQGWMFDQALIGPFLIRWPIESSKRNRGMPSNINIMTYGMRKAPDGR